MGLQYTVSPSLGLIDHSVINSVTFDLNLGIVVFGVAHYDAQNNQIGIEQLTDVAGATLIANIKTKAYAVLQAKRGAGVVT